MLTFFRACKMMFTCVTSSERSCQAQAATRYMFLWHQVQLHRQWKKLVPCQWKTPSFGITDGAPEASGMTIQSGACSGDGPISCRIPGPADMGRRCCASPAKMGRRCCRTVQEAVADKPGEDASGSASTTWIEQAATGEVQQSEMEEDPSFGDGRSGGTV